MLDINFDFQPEDPILFANLIVDVCIDGIELVSRLESSIDSDSLEDKPPSI